MSRVLSIGDTTRFDAPAIPHGPRLYHPDSHYVFPVDEQERERLNLQHDVVKRAFDGRMIFPPVNNCCSCFVLDSGAGSGAWLLDIAAKLSPPAILHGIDIGDSLFPRERPLNMSFSLNTITALPEDWSSKFDLVHQRFLLGALKSSEWPPALKEMSRVIRPGGWVQLVEAGAPFGGPLTDKHAGITRALFESRGLLLDVRKDLPSLLNSAGFVDVRVESRAIKLGRRAGQLGADARDVWIGALRGMMPLVLQSGGFGLVESETELSCLLDSVVKEWDEIDGPVMDVHVAYAQRPSD